MKFAVLDFCPHITGMTTYGKHAAAGIRALGHECDVVGFSKSGKVPDAVANPDPNKHGGRACHIDVTHYCSYEYGAEYLRQYDGLILNEPRNTVVDNAAVGLPFYVEMLRECGRPWTCMIGCPQYTADYAPYLKTLVERTNIKGFICAAVSFIPPSMRGVPVIISPFYPYARACSDAVREITPSEKSVWVCGRVAGNKGGWSSLFAVLDSLPTDWTYEFHGTCGRGMGPSTIVQVIEALRVQYGEKSLRWTSTEDQEWRPFRTDPFEMTLQTGHTVRYGGGFLVPPFLGERAPRVLLNLSSASFTMGTIEYIGLEALDRGLTLVTARHLTADVGYDVYSVPGHAENGTMTKTGFRMNRRNPDVGPDLVATLRKAMEHPTNSKRNWATLCSSHNPVIHARRLLTCLGLASEYELFDPMTLVVNVNEPWNPILRKEESMW